MKRYLILFLLFLIPSVYAVSYCGVDFAQENDILNSQGKSPLKLDQDGDLLINSTEFKKNTAISGTGNNNFLIRVGTTIKALLNSTLTQITGSLYEKSSISKGSNEFLIRNGSEYILKLDSSGNLYTKGTAVYDGSQAGCPFDGIVCENNYEKDRNYFCRSSDYGCDYEQLSSKYCGDSGWESSYYCTVGENEDIYQDYRTRGCSDGSGCYSYVSDTRVYEDCGDSGWNSNYCSGGGGADTDIVRDYYERGCATGTVCYSEYVQTETVQDCGVSGWSSPWCEWFSEENQYKTKRAYDERGCDTSDSSCYTTTTDVQVVDECGVTGWSDWYCSSDDKKRDWYDRGCESGSCTESITSDEVVDCGQDSTVTYCSGNDRMANVTYRGCDFNIDTNGCYETEETQFWETCSLACTDSDGGVEKYVGGYVEDDTGCNDGSCTTTTYYDTCTNYDTAINEHYCDNGYRITATLDCPNGCISDNGYHYCAP